MKTTILSGLFSFLLLVSAGCLKDDTCKNKTIASEDAAMQALAVTNGMVATRHSSGLYYQIVTAGSGPAPILTSNVSVRYIGKLSNGTVFDQATTPTSLYPVNGYISGWQVGLPLIKEGGTIRLIIPSALAYGCLAQGGGAIPANSILYFEIELVDVQ